MIWIMSVPLKPGKQTKLKDEGAQNVFKANLQNSNFNSESNVKEILSDERNEYLVNVNDKDNKYKDPADILEDVFRK